MSALPAPGQRGNVFSLIAGSPVKNLVTAVWFGSGLRNVALMSALLVFEASGKQTDAFNILWILVFGFATLNILALIARRFEPNRNRMNFGELVAVMTVVVSVFLLGWEMLTLFKVFPIRLSSH
jgi:hypothetical protein